jgi:hypothetical protein
MGASPLRISFYQPYPHRPPNRAGPKRKRIPYLVIHRPRRHLRLAGPFAHLGTKAGPPQAERDPALSQNPADSRIDLTCPIQSETASNKFRDHESTQFLLTPSTPKCSV